MDGQQQSSTRGTILSILLAFLFGGGFLLFLILVSGMFFLYVAGAVVAIAGIGAFHYLLWGHAMTQEIAKERTIDDSTMQIARERVDHVTHENRFRRY